MLSLLMGYVAVNLFTLLTFFKKYPLEKPIFVI